MSGNSKFLDLKTLFAGKKAAWILTACGLLGMILIFWGDFDRSPRKSAAAPEAVMEDYAAKLENKLEKMLSDLCGSPVRVLVTLETGYEYVYAEEITENREKTSETASSGAQRTQEKTGTQQKYVLVEDSDGRDTALRLTEISPRIKGVVVICNETPDEFLRGEIVSALMAALDVPSRRIYVTG